MTSSKIRTMATVGTCALLLPSAYLGCNKQPTNSPARTGPGVAAVGEGVPAPAPAGEVADASPAASPPGGVDPASSDRPPAGARGTVDEAPDGGAEIAALAARLADPLAEVRRAAAEALGKAGPDAAAGTGELIRCLRSDDDAIVRNNAAWALGKIGPAGGASVRALIEALGDPLWTVRHNAALSLTWIGEPAVAPLRQALTEGSAHSRVKAAGALQRILGEAAADVVPILIYLLGSTDAGVRSEAAETLGRFGPAGEAAVLALRESIADANAGVRLKAIDALAAIGGEATSAVPQIIAALTDDDERWVRVSAAQALGVLLAGVEHPAAIAALVAGFKDSKKRVRAFSALALGQIGAPAVPALKAVLRSGEKPERVLAMEAASTMGAPGTLLVPELRRALEDADPELRFPAAIALGGIAAALDPGDPVVEEIVSALDRALDDASEVVRAHAGTARRRIDAVAAKGGAGEAGP